MKVVLQRCLEANVVVDGQRVGEIQRGLLAFVGVAHEDTEAIARLMAIKTATLRIFQDQAGKMNLNVHEVGGDILSISQFTLLADCRRGRRPAFTNAASPDIAKRLYEVFNSSLRETGLRVPTGIFAADMRILLVNDGPVTILLDSEQLGGSQVSFS